MVIESIKRFATRNKGLGHKTVQSIKSAHADKRADELQSALYELAFHNAAEFVHSQLIRHESQFAGLNRNEFFNEIFIANFWMMDKVFSKYIKDIAKKMHHHYFGSLSDYAERTEAFKEKFKSYYLCWDEYTGHHNEYGLKIGENLFGKDKAFPEKQVSFWIITYTEDSLKKFRLARKQCLEAGLIKREEKK